MIMSENTKIEWADHTFNPWTGCTKVSLGCDGCYAEAWSKRAGAKVGSWGAGAPRVRTTPANWKQPLKWQAQAEREGRRFRVFCASLADVFDKEVAPEWRRDLFNLILATPSLDWLLLTKRIGNAARMIGEVLPASIRALPSGHPLAWPWPHVWIGATVCDQAEADRDIPKLLATPAAVRFVSIEPMLGPISFEGFFSSLRVNDGTNALEALGWVICGGESGPGARPMHPDWARSLRDQCDAAGVPFLFKQWGEWVPRGPESMGYPTVDGVPRIRVTDRGENGQRLGAAGGNDCWMQRTGKKAAGRLLDGRTHDGFPVS